MEDVVERERATVAEHVLGRGCPRKQRFGKADKLRDIGVRWKFSSGFPVLDRGLVHCEVVRETMNPKECDEVTKTMGRSRVGRAN